MATVIERFSDADSFTALLTRVGLSQRQRDRLIEDDFQTMEELVEHFQFSSGSEIESYLSGINKTFGNASQADRRVYFSPVMIGRIVGTILYFCHGLYTFHTIPDINEIDLERAVEFVEGSGDDKNIDFMKKENCLSFIEIVDFNYYD